MGPSLESNGMVLSRYYTAPLALASMGPSLESNGMQFVSVNSNRKLPASMGPSLESNGMFALRHVVDRQSLASMGPSLESNGMARLIAARSSFESCFNGAVARKQRNGFQRCPPTRNRRRFNGAVARKQRNATEPEYHHGPWYSLQWGRRSKATE